MRVMAYFKTYGTADLRSVDVTDVKTDGSKLKFFDKNGFVFIYEADTESNAANMLKQIFVNGVLDISNGKYYARYDTNNCPSTAQFTRTYKF